MNTGCLLIVGVIALSALLAIVDDLSFPESLLVSASVWQLWLLWRVFRKLDNEDSTP